MDFNGYALSTSVAGCSVTALFLAQLLWLLWYTCVVIDVYQAHIKALISSFWVKFRVPPHFHPESLLIHYHKHTPVHY